MARKIKEDELLEKIEKVNKKMEEINQEPIDNEKIVVKEEPKKTVKKVTKKEEKKTIKAETKPKEIQKSTKENSNLGLFEGIVILVNVALICCLLGYLLGIKVELKDKKEEYPTASKEIETLIEQYNYILQNYYGEIDKDKLISGAINGMLGSLDDYSEVLDNTSNTLQITLEGSYEGIGVTISNNDKGQIVVTYVYEDTPASKAGIQPGDILTYFDGESLLNVSTTDFVARVKKVNSFELTIDRNGTEIKEKLSRENINLKSVSSEMLENNIGYIRVSIFANNTYKQFKTALESLESQGMKSLIIDLRDNTGGHLTTAENMLGLFMDKSHIIYQTEDSSGISKTYSSGKKDKDYKIVILQNSYSASASEIISSSLKENLNAYIIGNTSFGKGTVQQLQTHGNIQFKLTTKKWLTPNGNWINGVGVKPDLEVSLTNDYLTNPTRDNDNQFKEAINYLK